MYIDDGRAPASGARALLRMARKRWVVVGVSVALFGGGAWWLADRSTAPDAATPVVQDLPSPVGGSAAAPARAHSSRRRRRPR